MHNVQKNIWLTIAFIGIFIPSFGQRITTGNLTSLSPKNPINKIYENYIFNNDIVLLADSRKVSELDILIVVLNQKKEIIQEEIIGTREAYDRPIGLIKKNKGYWLCANSVEKGKRTFKLYELDQSFSPIDDRSITIKNLDEVTAIKYDAKIVLIGQESTVNFTDFWVTKIKDGSVVWEKIYKTRLGGDVAMDVFFDAKSKKILVGGIGYNKMLLEKRDHYYHYRIIQLNKNGKLLESYVYKSKYKSNTRSMYSGMQQINNNYLMLGSTQDKTYSGKSFEDYDKMTPADLYFVLVNKEGDLKNKKTIETQTVDIPQSSIMLSEEKMLLIFSRDDKMKILEIIITE